MHQVSMPVINGPATISNGRDREGATVIALFKKGKYAHATVQEDSKKRIDDRGFSEDQDYEYTRNPAGRVFEFRLEEKGWVEVRFNMKTGRWNKVGYGARVGFGHRRAFYDFSF